MNRLYTVQKLASLAFILYIPTVLANTNDPKIIVEKSVPPKVKTIQDCPSDIWLSTQAQIDSFPSKYNCTTFKWLRVSGSDITNVDSLYKVESVGTLTINLNDNLTNIRGLSSLRSITEVGFFIGDNPKLTSLDGLSSLEQISPEDLNAQFTITDNVSLEDIGALSNLTVVGSVVIINTSIGNLTGLSSLRSAKTLEIRGNPRLTNLNGLEQLTELSEYLGRAITIENNASLADLHGLDNISSTNGSVIIRNNPSLVSVDGLNSLSEIGGE